jgi:nucleoid DNA-binding protein
LNPKKAKDFIKVTANKTGQSDKLVAAVVNYYWKNIRQDIVNMEYMNISVANLGTFKVKHWKIDEIVTKYTRAVNKLDGEFKKFHIKKKLEERIALLENIKKQALETTEKFNKIKNLRNEQSKNNMEKQNFDSKGTDQQDI